MNDKDDQGQEITLGRGTADQEIKKKRFQGRTRGTLFPPNQIRPRGKFEWGKPQ